MVIPVMPTDVSFCFTSSSLKGLIIASIFFIDHPSHASKEQDRRLYVIALSNIEVQGEFMGMGSEPNRIDLLLALVVKPGLYHILGKYIPPKQKVVILLQRIECLIQRPRHRLHLRRLLRLQLI